MFLKICNVIYEINRMLQYKHFVADFWLWADNVDYETTFGSLYRYIYKLQRARHMQSKMRQKCPHVGQEMTGNTLSQNPNITEAKWPKYFLSAMAYTGLKLRWTSFKKYSLNSQVTLYFETVVKKQKDISVVSKKYVYFDLWSLKSENLILLSWSSDHNSSSEAYKIREWLTIATNMQIDLHQQWLQLIINNWQTLS